MCIRCRIEVASHIYFKEKIDNDASEKHAV